MNVIARPRMSLAEFLAWEQEQPERYEFDGSRPIPMNGGTLDHARVIDRITDALKSRVSADYEVLGVPLKVATQPGRIRYPDVVVLARGQTGSARTVEPIVVIEVLSPSTRKADLRDKPTEYATVPSILAYVILPVAGDWTTKPVVLRRSADWVAEPIGGTLDLPEIGVVVPMDAVYG